MAKDIHSAAPERPASSEVSAAAPLKRSQLIEKYREQSLHKKNPLAANLALINSDLMVFAQANAESVSPPSRPESSPEASRRLERQANLHLRLARQIDRLARIDEELENRGKSQAGDGTEAKN